MSENLKFRIIEKYESGGGAKLPIDYEDPKQVIHRPSINDVELVGNKTSEELGLVDASQIVSITERIDGHDAQIGDMQTQIDDIESDVANAKTDITQLKSDVSNHADKIASLDETVAEHTTAISDLELAKTDKSYVDGLVDSETTNRENAENQLQEQIDAIVSSSDVRDIVGTYADLQAYDTSTLGNNDIVKVLSDSSHDNAMSYYRWNATAQQWSYIGSEGAYYTKSESDSRFVPNTRTINNKALSTNIELNATDVGAQEKLVSGSNIKTINGQSLLEGGNIDIQGGSVVFIATYGVTTFEDIQQAYIGNKNVWLIKGNDLFQISSFIKNGSAQYILHHLFGTASTLFGYTYYVDKTGDNTQWVERIYLYPSTTNLKTINNQSIVGNGNIEIGGGTVDSEMSDTSENAVQNKVIKTYVDDSVTIDKIKLGNAELPIIDKAVTIPNFIYAITRTQFSLQAHNVNGVHDNSLTIQKVSGKDRLKFLAWDNVEQEVVFEIDVPNANELTFDTEMSDTSEKAVQNKVIKSYIDNREPVIEVQGNWYYRIYNDGTFEAWYGASGITYVINEQSGNLARSNLQTLTLPTNLTDQGTIEIISFDVGVGHNNYPVFSTIANMSDTEIKYYVMSGNTRSSSPNYKLSAYVFGKITRN